MEKDDKRQDEQGSLNSALSPQDEDKEREAAPSSYMAVQEAESALLPEEGEQAAAAPESGESGIPEAGAERQQELLDPEHARTAEEGEQEAEIGSQQRERLAAEHAGSTEDEVPDAEFGRDWEAYSAEHAGSSDDGEQAEAGRQGQEESVPGLAITAKDEARVMADNEPGDLVDGELAEDAESHWRHSGEEIEPITESELNEMIEKLCESKASEFHMLGYEHVTDRDVWECVSDKYQKTGVPPLHRVVNDILSLRTTQFMNWMTMSIYKKG